MSRPRFSLLFLLLVMAPLLAQKPRIVAEWEDALGTMIVWPLAIPCELVQELARHDHLWVLVANERVRDEAQSAFRDWGIAADRVSFIITSVESPWTRDFGPHQLFDADGRMIMLDSIYINTPLFPQKPPPVKRGDAMDYFGESFPGDDRTNEDVAAYFKRPLVSVEAYLTGGNFLVDGHGTAFVTRAMLDENNVLMSDESFHELVAQVAGVDRVVVLENTEPWGIQHIDCFLKVLDPETLLVKRVPENHPEFEPIQRNLEILAKLKSCYGRPYRIYRIDCPPYRKGRNFKTGQAEDWVPAYTNALILNKRIYVPLFNTAADDVAIKTYGELMHGYEIVGVPSQQWFPFDALHCRTRALFDPAGVRLSHIGLRDQQAGDRELTVSVALADGLGRKDWTVSLIYRDNQGEWQSQALRAEDNGNYVGTLPALGRGRQVSYYLEAECGDGRKRHLPRTAPQGQFQFKTAQ